MDIYATKLQADIKSLVDKWLEEHRGKGIEIEIETDVTVTKSETSVTAKVSPAYVYNLSI